MVNIIRSLILSLIGLATLAWISVVLISIMLVGPDPDSALTEFFAEYIIVSTRVEELGYTFSEISDELFILVAHMNISLFLFTLLMTLSWSTWSHYLNIDAPGKAKIYSIHWVVFTGVFIGILLAIIAFFTQTTQYDAADLIGRGGYIILSFSALFYFLMYYVGVLLGTARFARSSVLLANKLPGGF
tara:strand:+ start:3330 stop:3890 length:561 start_codon:yes stop_codon:yes gene_type:complete